jgi:hypothetical protein
MKDVKCFLRKVIEMKIVINSCYGGFGLSYEAVMLYAKLKGIKLYAFQRKVDKKSLTFEKCIPYKKGDKAFMISYSTKPLKDGKYEKDSYFLEIDIERNDPALVKVVETLGKKASGDCAELRIVEIPKGIKWSIDEYDGIESIHEEHRSWS